MGDLLYEGSRESANRKPSGNSLSTYRAKRTLVRTPEPAGAKVVEWLAASYNGAR